MTLPDLTVPQPDVRIEALRLAILDMRTTVEELAATVTAATASQADCADDRATLHAQMDQQSATLAALSEQVTALGG
jgi:hypothetical protein